tara:strand:- start:752 stop:970 length:219 start_codon:yes stop_codon:yes gene_type:complete
MSASRSYNINKYKENKLSKTYTCKDCNETKNLGTNAKLGKPYWIKKIQEWDNENQLWIQDLCTPCGEARLLA